MIWGLTLQPGQSCTRELKEEVHLSLATLESRADMGKECSYSQVLIATGDSEQLLCTLVHGMIFQQCLDLKLMPQEKVTFTVHGSNTVFITGYTSRIPERHRDENEGIEETGKPEVNYGGSSALVGQETLADPYPSESTRSDSAVMVQRLGESVYSETAQRNIRQAGKQYGLRKRTIRHRVGGKLSWNAETTAKRKKVSADFAPKTSVDQALISSFPGLTSLDLSTEPSTDDTSQLHQFKTVCGSSGSLSQPPSPSLPEFHLDSRPSSEPSFASQYYSDASPPQSIMTGPSLSPSPSAVVKPPENAVPQLTQPGSANTLGSSSQPLSLSLPVLQHPDGQPLSVHSVTNTDNLAVKMPPSSIPYMSSSRSLYQPPHQKSTFIGPMPHALKTLPLETALYVSQLEYRTRALESCQGTPPSLPSSVMPYVSSSTQMYPPPHQEPVITPLPKALQSLPLDAALFVSQLENRVRTLEFQRESQQEAVVVKSKTPSYSEESGIAIIGKDGGPTLRLDVDSYTTVWAKSTNGTDFVVKLMPLVFSEEVLAASNYHGGQVFSGGGWVRKDQLRDHPSFVAIMEQARIEYPGSFTSVEQCEELQDAVNAKCSEASDCILKE